MPKKAKQNQGGQVCHSLQSESDWNLFRLSLIQADEVANRKKLPACSFSAEMLGMWIVARVKTAKVEPRKQAAILYKGGLARCGLGGELGDLLPDSPIRMYCLDTIEEYIKEMCVATDKQRTELAALAWESVYDSAKEAIADEGYGDLFND